MRVHTVVILVRVHSGITSMCVHTVVILVCVHSGITSMCVHTVVILVRVHSGNTSDVLEHKWRASLKTILFLYG